MVRVLWRWSFCQSSRSLLDVGKLLFGHAGKGKIKACLEMQVANGEGVAWVEIVIHRFAVAEFLDGAVFLENPIGD